MNAPSRSPNLNLLKFLRCVENILRYKRAHENYASDHRWKVAARAMGVRTMQRTGTAVYDNPTVELIPPNNERSRELLWQFPIRGCTERPGTEFSDTPYRGDIAFGTMDDAGTLTWNVIIENPPPRPGMDWRSSCSHWHSVSLYDEVGEDPVENPNSQAALCVAHRVKIGYVGAPSSWTASCARIRDGQIVTFVPSTTPPDSAT